MIAPFTAEAGLRHAWNTQRSLDTKRTPSAPHAHFKVYEVNNNETFRAIREDTPRLNAPADRRGDGLGGEVGTDPTGQGLYQSDPERLAGSAEGGLGRRKDLYGSGRVPPRVVAGRPG